MFHCIKVYLTVHCSSIVRVCIYSSLVDFCENSLRVGADHGVEKWTVERWVAKASTKLFITSRREPWEAGTCNDGVSIGTLGVEVHLTVESPAAVNLEDDKNYE